MKFVGKIGRALEISGLSVVGAVDITLATNIAELTNFELSTQTVTALAGAAMVGVGVALEVVSNND